MGLDIFLYDGDTKIGDIPSLKYPKHFCNRSYLRSSYSSGGFNHVVSNLIGKDLYDIFCPGGDEYEIHYSKEELLLCKERAEEVVKLLKAVKHPLRVIDVCDYNDFPAVDERKAIKLVEEEIAKREVSIAYFDWYGNRDGEFFMENPPEIMAAIPGRNILNRPCVHLVYKADISFYIQMAEITVEFIEIALTLEDPVLHWSA